MASVLARRKLLVAPNPLAYPAGSAPGFDPNHVAAKGIVRYSGIANGNTFLSLLSGKPATVAGAPVALIDSSIGPAVRHITNSDFATISGQSTATDANVTYAAIINYNATTGSAQVIFENCLGGSTGYIFYLQSSRINVFANASSTNLQSGAYMSTGVYFIAFSNNASVANFIAKNLQTGQVFTTATTSMAAEASNGVYAIGNNFNQPANVPISAVMYSATFMAMSQLLQWASDPWSFWYPRPAIQYTTPVVTASTGGGARYKQRWNRSALAYPAGAVAGFDSSHIAAGPNAFSATSLGGGFVDLTIGRVGAPIVAAASGGINSRMGPTASITDHGKAFAFSSRSQSLVGQSSTVGGIFQITAFQITGGNFNTILSTDNSGGGGYEFCTTSGGNLAINQNSGTTRDSTLPLAVGVQYFACASINGTSSIDFLLMRLDTGQITTASIAGASMFASANPATFAAGCVVGVDGLCLNGTLAAVMYSPRAIGLAAMKQWAADPWSFWYPNKTINLTSTAASVGASFLPVWAVGYNLPVIGTGIY